MVHTLPSQCNVSVCGSVNDVGCCVPAAHTLSEAIAVTPARLLSTSGPTFGLGTRLQAAPFQCSVRVESSSPVTPVPTAQTSFAETTATPARLPTVVPGLAMMLHATPFQCSMIGVVEKPVIPRPTAQTSFVLTAATASRILIDAVVFGLLTTAQRVPSQCSISVLDLVKLLSV